MNVEQSKIFAKIQGRIKSSYEHVRRAEAKAAGRMLPGGLTNAVAQVTGAKVDEDKNGDPYFLIYSTVLEPREYFGVFQGFMHRFLADKFNTEQENQRRLSSDLKLLGYEGMILRHDSLSSLLQEACERLSEEKPVFLFNTGRKPRKDGSHTAFIQGPAPRDYVPPGPVANNEQKDNGYVAVDENKPRRGRPRKNVPPAASTGNSYEEGDAVITVGDYFEQGEEYEGTVVSVEDGAAVVRFPDDSEHEIPLENLKPLA